IAHVLHSAERRSVLDEFVIAQRFTAMEVLPPERLLLATMELDQLCCEPASVLLRRTVRSIGGHAVRQLCYELVDDGITVGCIIGLFGGPGLEARDQRARVPFV